MQICVHKIGGGTTANYMGYVQTCAEAAVNDEVLNSFRTIPSYRSALKIAEADSFPDYIRRRFSGPGKYLDRFRMIDSVGAPPLTDYQHLGLFSPTVLRYIFHADQILNHFSLPKDAKIAEIGAGFGGQVFVLQQMHPCSKYYIYDLPEVGGLIEKVTARVNPGSVTCLPLDEDLPESEIDLVISNYAYEAILFILKLPLPITESTPLPKRIL